MALNKASRDAIKNKIAEETASGTDAKREASPEASLPLERVLISPRNKFTFFVHYWVTELADDGTPVRGKKAKPVRLHGFKTVGTVAGDRDAREMPAETRERMLMEITEEQAERYNIPAGPRTYEGCSVVLDRQFAESLGLEDDEDNPNFPEWKTPLKAEQKLWETVEKSSSYGRVMAFIDDVESFEKLIPQFEKNRETKMMNEEDARDYIALEAMREAGIR